MLEWFESSRFSLSPGDDDDPGAGGAGADDPGADGDLDDDDELEDDDDFDEEFEDELIDLDDEYDKHNEPVDDTPPRPKRSDFQGAGQVLRRTPGVASFEGPNS